MVLVVIRVEWPQNPSRNDNDAYHQHLDRLMPRSPSRSFQKFDALTVKRARESKARLGNTTTSCLTYKRRVRDGTSLH